LKILTNLLIFFIGGFFAGILSLIFLSLLPTSNLFYKNFELIIVTIIEDSVKLLFLWFILNLLNELTTFKKMILLAIVFGVGFSLFESILIILSKFLILNYGFLLIICIHMLTSLFFILFITDILNLKKLSTKTALYLMLAYFIHLCYNLNV